MLTSASMRFADHVAAFGFRLCMDRISGYLAGRLHTRTGQIAAMMMQGLRKAGQTWLGKLVVGVLFGLLILSFAVWGIADVFRGGSVAPVATVGNTTITTEQVRTAYQTELQNLSRRLRRTVTNEQARSLGLDQQIVSKMVAEAALDERISQLGLSISDKTIADAITNDPAFKGINGQFDRNVFAQTLRDNGFTEQRFVAEQRKVYLRQHLAEALTGGMTVPVVMKEALHRLTYETRALEYIVLPAAGIDPGQPDDAALQAFFTERKANFRAPEYRTVNLVTLTPDAVAKPDSVTEADVRKFYDSVKAQRFGTAERRRIQRIGFKSMDDAKAAADKIKAGATFETIATEQGVKDADRDLGLLARAEVLDKALAEAAYALTKDSVSEPVNGDFGPVLLRVTDIQPEAIQPYEQVAATLRTEMAVSAARQTLREVHDKIEEQRATAKPLPEIAAAVGLAVRTVEIDRQGRDRSGKPVENLTDVDSVVRAVFASDIGVDNEAVSLRDSGYIWFDVTKIDAEKERPLADVRDQVVAGWRTDALAKKLSDNANAIIKKVEAGDTLAAAAAPLDIKTAAELKRDTALGDISRSAAAQAFNLPQGKWFTAPAANGTDRLVARVTSIAVPPFTNTSQESVQMEERIRQSTESELLAQYINRLQTDLRVQTNDRSLRLAIGGEQ